jgi:orsellinic acid C2-O-methyltransferase
MAASTIERLVTLVDDIAMFQMLCAAVELDLPERLAEGPRSAADLAAQNDWHQPSVARLLRALASTGFVDSSDAGCFALTEEGQALRKWRDGSMAHWLLLWGRDLWRQWPELGRCVRTGTSARQHLLAASGLDHLERDEVQAQRFHQAMHEIGSALADTVVRVGDFGRFMRIVDVGGGHAHLLTKILSAHPGTSGVLLERPHALRGARDRLEEAGLRGRYELVAGDFFQAVPAGADAYLLQHVLHDWDDERSTRLLACCKAAMREDSVLVIVEHRMPDLSAVPDRRSARKDLNMMIGPGGCERSEAQYTALLGSCSLAVVAIRSAGDHWILEVVRIDSEFSWGAATLRR